MKALRYLVYAAFLMLAFVASERSATADPNPENHQIYCELWTCVDQRWGWYGAYSDAQAADIDCECTGQYCVSEYWEDWCRNQGTNEWFVWSTCDNVGYTFYCS